jgi:hypothetical protein
LPGGGVAGEGFGGGRDHEPGAGITQAAVRHSRALRPAPGCQRRPLPERPIGLSSRSVPPQTAIVPILSDAHQHSQSRPLQPKAIPAPGVHFFALDAGGVLFCEPAQRFYDLNSTAALCWLALSEGLGEAAILEELVRAGAPPGDAQSWWRQSLALFEAEGFLAGSPPRQRDVPPFDEGLREGQRLERIPDCVVHRFYRLFDTRFRIGFTSEAPLASADSMLARLADRDVEADAQAHERPADVEITVIGVGERYLVARGMGLVGVTADLSGLMEKIESALMLTAIDATPHLLSLHGGALAKGDCGLLLPAPSGSGKTTLSAALNLAGWNFGSDEISLLDSAADMLRVAPMSACIKEGSWPVLASLTPALMAQPVHQRAGRTVRYLPPVGRTVDRYRATHVVFPRYARESETSLMPLSASTGLQRLLAECVSIPRRLTEKDAAQLVEWASGLSFFDLKLSELPTALALLDNLAAKGN